MNPPITQFYLGYPGVNFKNLSLVKNFFYKNST